MKVHQIMRSEARTCAPEDTAAAAGRLMREVDCGWLPVVRDTQPVGVVTDRDLYLALTDGDRKPSELRVQEAMTTTVYGCKAGDEVREALDVMREHRVRRLPVLDDSHELTGMLSIDDIVLAARPVAEPGFTGPFYSDVATVLRAIVEHPLPPVVA